MRLCRCASGFGLLLLALQVCSLHGKEAPAPAPKTKATPPKQQMNTSKSAGHPPGFLQSINGVDTRSLYESNPADVLAAYKECVKHGAACSIPCTAISNCAGCYPGSGNTTVCGFCMPGTLLTADQRSCVPCEAANSCSRGGRATTCTPCTAGQSQQTRGQAGGWAPHVVE